MEFNGVTSNFPGSNAEALAVVLFKGEKAGSAGIKELDALTGGQIAAAIKDGEIKGASGETALFRLKTGGGTKASRLLVIGCGDKDKFKLSGCRHCRRHCNAVRQKAESDIGGIFSSV